MAIVTGRLVPCRPNQLEELDKAVGEQLESGGASRCRWERGVHPAEVVGGTGERNPQGFWIVGAEIYNKCEG